MPFEPKSLRISNACSSDLHHTLSPMVGAAEPGQLLLKISRASVGDGRGGVQQRERDSYAWSYVSN